MSWAEDMGFDAYSFYDMPGQQEIALLLDPESLRLYWTTKDKQRIFIEDMETSHIENIVRAGINGKLHCTEATEARFLLELSLRYRQAQPEPEVIKNLPF